MTTFNVNTFDVAAFDAILARGLSSGLGNPNGQMCIEAAICNVMGLPHSDDPKCVAKSVRQYKIALNDKQWSSEDARAKGLRSLGLAQLGSLGVVNNEEFTKKLAEKTIRVLIPDLFRRLFPENQQMLSAALRCEKEGTKQVANAAAYAAANANAANAANAADAAAYAANAANAANAADAAAYAANAANAANAAENRDYYLNLSASLALEVLQELNSPGCSLL